MTVPEETTREPLRIAYFPYLFMGDVEEIDLGFARVWNWGRRSRREIPDDKVRDYIKRLLEEYRYYRRPIRHMGLVSMKGRACHQITDKDLRQLNEVRILLFLCYAANSNIHREEDASHLAVTSENFSLIHQNILLGKERTGYVGGRIIPVIAGGRKIGDHPVETPPYVLRGSMKRFDKNLLGALLRLSSRKRRPYNKLLTASAAMMDGYYNAPDHPEETSILAQCRGFEVLLDLPTRKQRKVFKEHIATLCAEKTARRYPYTFETRPEHKKSESAPQVAIWADRFYTLRNAIIHGDDLRRRHFLYHGQRHTDLALWFFLVCLKKKVDEGLGEDLFHDVIRYTAGSFEYDAKPLDRVVEELAREVERREARKARRAQMARRRRARREQGVASEGLDATDGS